MPLVEGDDGEGVRETERDGGGMGEEPKETTEDDWRPTDGDLVPEYTKDGSDGDDN